MTELSDSFIAAIDNFSIADLRKERDRLQVELQDKKQQVDRAAREYSYTQRSLQIVDMVIGMREEKGQTHTFIVGNPPYASESDKPLTKTTVTVGPGTGKSRRMLELLKLSSGMGPGELYKALTAEGWTMRRQYVTTALTRLKKRGEVYLEDGKYFAVEDTDKVIADIDNFISP